MRRILVVDDSRVVRQQIRRIVESLGFAVDEATDGQQALQYCRTVGLPSGIILDLTMPVMDGMSFLRILRADPLLKICPVVVCSTSNTAAQLQEALTAGADEYVMKPFTNDILLDKLRQIGLIT